MSLKSLMEKIKSRGSVTPVTSGFSGGVTVKPAYSLACTSVTSVTPHLSETCVNALFGQFGEAVNDPAKPVKQTFLEHAGAWLELDQAYQLHHFQCKACQAAGRGANYGQRCDTGLALWLAYQAII